MTTTNNHEQLDKIRLDDFSFKRPSGAITYPHAGQSVWVKGYGIRMSDTARLDKRLNAATDSVARIGLLAEFLASRIVKWDVLDPESGDALPPPTPEAIADLPDDLFIFLTRRIRGVETEGEGSAASGG